MFCRVISTFNSNKHDSLIVGTGSECKRSVVNKGIPVIFHVSVAKEHRAKGLSLKKILQSEAV